MTAFSGKQKWQYLPTNWMLRWEQGNSKDDGYVSGLSNGSHSLQCKDRKGEEGWPCVCARSLLKPTAFFTHT